MLTTWNKNVHRLTLAVCLLSGPAGRARGGESVPAPHDGTPVGAFGAAPVPRSAPTAVVSDEEIALATSKNSGDVKDLRRFIRNDLPITGFDLVAQDGKNPDKPKGTLRVGPGLRKVNAHLQRRQHELALATLEQTVEQVLAAKQKYRKLRPQKQVAATKRALKIGRQDCRSHRFVDAVYSAMHQSSPILLDLDEDGRADVTSRSLGGEGPFVREGSVLFDITGKGVPTRTEWVLPGQDGLLFLDKDGNGLANGAGELFGDADGFGDGYAKLRQLDADGDHQIRGAELSNLRVWIDDGDGRCEPAESRTATELEILSIATDHHEYRSSYVRAGRTLAAWDWWPLSE